MCSPLDVERSSPDVERSSPDVVRSSPDVVCSSPDVERSSPDVERSSPDVVRSSPDVVCSSPDVERSSPDVEHSSRVCAAVQCSVTDLEVVATWLHAAVRVQYMIMYLYMNLAAQLTDGVMNIDYYRVVLLLLCSDGVASFLCDHQRAAKTNCYRCHELFFCY